MYCMSVHSSLCFCLLDWEVAVLVKLREHTSRCSILYLEVRQCSLCYCYSTAEQVQLTTNCLDILDYLKAVSIFCGGASFRRLLLRCLLCLFISGSQKLT
jgi:hypothetical protein